VDSLILTLLAFLVVAAPARAQDSSCSRDEAEECCRSAYINDKSRAEIGGRVACCECEGSDSLTMVACSYWGRNLEEGGEIKSDAWPGQAIFESCALKHEQGHIKALDASCDPGAPGHFAPWRPLANPDKFEAREYKLEISCFKDSLKECEALGSKKGDYHALCARNVNHRVQQLEQALSRLKP